MSRQALNRRQFLTLPVALLVTRLTPALAAERLRSATYEVDVGAVYDMLTFHLAGTMEERVDYEAGRYRVTLAGQGAGIANSLESTGILRDGRWAPLRATSYFQVQGRESRSEVAYDYRQGTVDYRLRGETFFLRRLRVVEDRLSLPDGVHVDDVISATLNYAERRWPAQADGRHRTLVVRRQRREDEGPDDVQRAYRAELAPVVVDVRPDGAGKTRALVDLTRFSSWARQSRPARIVFGTDRRPESIVSSLMLGTSLSIRIRAA